MSIASDPFEVAKAKGPDLGKLRSLQRISTLKVKRVPKNAPQSAQVTEAQQSTRLVKKNDPFGVSKADNTTSTTGRKVTAALFPGYHGAIAAKKGKRLRSAGNEYVRALGGSVAGGTAGQLAGAAITRGRPAGTVAGGTVGGVGGVFAGAVRGNNVNQRKGYLKGRG